MNANATIFESHVPTAAELAADAAWREDIVHHVRKWYSATAAIYLTFVVVTAVWFAVRTRQDAALAKRSVLLTMLGFVGNFLISFPFLLLQSMSFPCFIILSSLYLGVTFTIFSLAARAWRLRYLFSSNQDKLTRMQSLQNPKADSNAMSPAGKVADIDEEGDVEIEKIQATAEAEEDDLLEPLGRHAGGGGTAIGAESHTSTLHGSTGLSGSALGTSMLGSNVSFNGQARTAPRSSGGHLGPRSGSGALKASGSAANVGPGGYTYAGRGGVGVGGGSSLLRSQAGGRTASIGSGRLSSTDRFDHRRASDMFRLGAEPQDVLMYAEEGRPQHFHQDNAHHQPGVSHASNLTANSSGVLGTSFIKRYTQGSVLAPTPLEEPTRRLLLILFIVTLIVLVYVGVVLTSSTQYSPSPMSFTCKIASWEMTPVLIAFGGFLMIGCPVLCWWLWNYNDTYGIRRDLIVFGMAGTIVGIAYSVQQVLVPTGMNYGDMTFRLYFGASNWPVIGVAVGHLTSIFFPLLNSYNIHPTRPISDMLQQLYRSASRDSNASDPATGGTTVALKGSTDAVPSIPNSSPAPRRVSASPPATRRKSTGGSKRARKAVTWTLFQSVLDDPLCFEAFKAFAARDFAAEAPLFYQEYKKLMEKVRAEDGPPRPPLRAETPPPAGSTYRMHSFLQQESAILEHLPGALNRNAATSNDSVRVKYPIFDFTDSTGASLAGRFIHAVTRGKYGSNTNTRLGSSSTRRSRNSGFLFGSRSEPTLVAPPVAASAGGLLIPASLREDYRTLCRTFIASGAPLKISLSPRVVEEIAKQVGEESRMLPLVSVFDEARNEVLAVMYEMFERASEEDADLRARVRRIRRGSGGRRGSGE
ncbi:hypothetical protein HDU87_006021 [Geranomyces variabilis]|uniref:RGS domain-containing protein n=1 Tax=Geranomyces variabilis TaxID=109894 RepID=A0AAD5TQS6_9FUNG|nr:hypothetical protein HDU87_006021 [Geranomyces variabilis]